MNCCTKCFNDVEIIDIIKNRNTKGGCDFCGNTNVNIYQLDNDSTLTDMFGEFLDTYTPVSNLPISFPRENIDLIKNILHNRWSIFNVDSDCIYRLITAICHEKYIEHPELFDTPVGIAESVDKDYLKEYSVIKEYSWNDFVKAIKSKNRFHTEHINTKVLKLFISCVRKTYKAGKVFYRARICSNENGFSKREMGAPPELFASAGRVNPSGISVLYLADSPKTTLHEIRAGIFDYVTVGNFRLNKDIEIINFASLDKISPFITDNIGISYTQLAINLSQLKQISQDIAKPLRRHDTILDYLPTQYISDYIKSQNYHGVEYISTMCSNGFNLAVFDPNFFKCVKASVFDIKSLEYTFEQIKD